MIVLWFFVPLAFPTVLKAEVLITKEKALKLAFPDADTIEKKSLFLTDDQSYRIEQKYKVNIPTKLFLINIAKRKEKILGYSIIDTHSLRTKSQTIMVFINPNGSLNYVEILAFYEPPEYKVSVRWLDLFRNKTINYDLRSGHDIPNITGATISSNGTSEAVRRVLSVFDYYIHGEKIN